mmetsp:Transcript_28328/g.25139  ORF Transcript_28328/g.25139 Transcript_28328/m.25139 type:complete len:239 (-) Transcript_28328:165-881(-)
MGHINNKISVIFLAFLLKIDKVMSVRIHGIEGFTDDDNGIILVLFSDFFDFVHHGLIIQMLGDVYVLCGSLGTFLKTVVGKSIHNNVIIVSDESSHDTIAGHPTSRVDDNARHSHIVSHLLLEVEIVGMSSVSKGSTTTVNSEFLNGSNGLLLGAFISSQTEVILGGKVWTLKIVSMHIMALRDSVTSSDGSFEIKPELIFLLNVQHVAAFMGSFEEVGTLGSVEGVNVNEQLTHLVL